MMYGNGGWGWGAWLMMTTVMFGFWGLVAWVVVTLARDRSAGPHLQRSAEDILAERFARGEIDKDEYTSRLDALRSKR